jgi:hypothetical protein
MKDLDYENNKELIDETIRKIQREKAKQWRDNNKDKVKEINRRYWINKAKKLLEEQEK